MVSRRWPVHNRAKEALTRAIRHQGQIRGPPDAAARFGSPMRCYSLGGGRPTHKAWTGAIIDPIQADRASTLFLGRKNVQEQTIASGKQLTPGVRKRAANWRRGSLLTLIVIIDKFLQFEVGSIHKSTQNSSNRPETMRTTSLREGWMPIRHPKGGRAVTIEAGTPLPIFDQVEQRIRPLVRV